MNLFGKCFKPKKDVKYIYYILSNPSQQNDQIYKACLNLLMTVAADERYSFYNLGKHTLGLIYKAGNQTLTITQEYEFNHHISINIFLEKQHISSFNITRCTVLESHKDSYEDELLYITFHDAFNNLLNKNKDVAIGLIESIINNNQQHNNNKTHNTTGI